MKATLKFRSNENVNKISMILKFWVADNVHLRSCIKSTMKVIVLFVLILGFFASVGNSLVEERVLRRVFSGVGHFFQNMAQLKKIKDNSDDLRGYMREIR